MLWYSYKKSCRFQFIKNDTLTTFLENPNVTNYFLEGHLDTIIGVSWEEGKTLAINLDVMYEKESRLFLTVKSVVYTPLDNWKVTKIEGV